MQFTLVHNNLNVTDLEKSVEFYQKALGMAERRRKQAADGSFTLVFLGNPNAPHEIELTWLRDFHGKYNLGDNEIHLACTVDNMEQAHALHESMDCICFENPEMGIYFIQDPDGYWIEIIPEK